MVVVAISIPVSTYGKSPNSLKLAVLKGGEIARKPRRESGCIAKSPLKTHVFPLRDATIESTCYLEISNFERNDLTSRSVWSMIEEE